MFAIVSEILAALGGSAHAATTTPWWQQPTICRMNPTDCYVGMGAGYDNGMWDAGGNCWGMKLICPEATVATNAAPVPTAVAGNYYVIAGTFSTEENADRFIASARKIDDSLPFRKIPQRNGRIMVSIFESDSQQQAVRKKREYEAIFEGVWIHRAR